MLQAPRCLHPALRPPPMISFQSRNDETVPFCSPYLYRPGSAYWLDWAKMAKCSLSSAEIFSYCPSESSTNVQTTTNVLRAYVGNCYSPTALIWTSESKPDYGYHQWPDKMSAFGELDGTGVAIKCVTYCKPQQLHSSGVFIRRLANVAPRRFFSNILNAHDPSKPSREQAFLNLLPTPLNSCCNTSPPAETLWTNCRNTDLPCGASDLPALLKVIESDLSTLTSGLPTAWILPRVSTGYRPY
jgi:hypothetical protein